MFDYPPPPGFAPPATPGMSAPDMRTPGMRIREWWQRNLSPDAAVEAAWGMLPPNVRQVYGGIPNTVAEFSPGAAIRDTLNESGDLTRATLAGDPLGMATAASGMGLAALGIIPGGRLGKVAKEGVDAVRIAHHPQLPPLPQQWTAGPEKYPRLQRQVAATDSAAEAWDLTSALRAAGVKHSGASAEGSDYFSLPSGQSLRVSSHPPVNSTSAMADLFVWHNRDGKLVVGVKRDGSIEHEPFNGSYEQLWRRLTNEVPAAIGHNMGPALTNVAAPPPRAFKSVFNADANTPNIWGENFAAIKEFLPDNFNRLSAVEKKEAARAAYARYEELNPPASRGSGLF